MSTQHDDEEDLTNSYAMEFAAGMKLCPLWITRDPTEDPMCRGIHCAWWDTVRTQCAIVSIGRTLVELRYELAKPTEWKR